jgi:hypothetical protein
LLVGYIRIIVIRHCIQVVKIILDQLKSKDLLKLRRVCQTSYGWVNNYTKLEERLQDCTVNVNDSNLSEVTPRMLPLTKFDVVLQSQSDKGLLKAFMDNFDARTVNINVMQCCVDDEELAFYESMTSLENLTIRELKTTSPQTLHHFPQNCFENLHTLVVKTSSCPTYFLQVCKLSTNLENVTIPVLTGNLNTEGTDAFSKALFYLLKSRKRKRQSQIKQISGDIGPYISHRGVSGWNQEVHTDAKLLKLIEDEKIRLFDVDSDCLHNIHKRDVLRAITALESIVSVREVADSLHNIRLPNLEKIADGSGLWTWSCSYPNALYPDWPNLRSIQIQYTQYTFRDYNDYDFFVFLMITTTRANVECIELDFHASNDPLVSLSSIDWPVAFPNLNQLLITTNTFYDIKDVLISAANLMSLEHFTLRNLSEVLPTDEMTLEPLLHFKSE